MSLFKFFKRKLPLAWLQISHERKRLLVAVLGIAFADFLMFMQLGFQAGLYESNTLLHRKLKADLVLVSPQALYIAFLNDLSRRRIYQAKNYENVVSVAALYVDYAVWKHPKTKRETTVLFLGFNPKKTAIDIPEVADNLDRIKFPDAVLLDRVSKGDYQTVIDALKAGEIVSTEVGIRRVNVVGFYDLGANFSTNVNIITSDLNFFRLFPHRDLSRISIGLLTLTPGTDPKSMARVLQADLPNDVQVLTLEEFAELEKKYWARVTPIGFIFGLGVAIGFMVGTMTVYQILYSNVADHLPEYATLKAMGYHDRYLLGVVLQQALVLAILGFIPGAIVSWGLYHLASSITLLPIVMTGERALSVLVATIAMSTLSGGIAIQKLREADPADIY